MRKRNNPSWKVRLGVCCVLALCMAIGSGCGAARPSKYYALSMPPGSAPAADPPFPVTLLLGPLEASHLYREDKIVYSTSGESMGTYETHRWVEPPTDLIQTVLFRELRASGKYRGVNALRSSAHGDYVLHGQLYDFKEVSGNGIVARVTLEYSLRDTKTGENVWSHYYSHDEPVNEKSVSAIVAALDRNVHGILDQVQAGLEQYFTAHPPAPPSAPAQ
jgi:ABC-type uncharacterized transport system auxiliary subunit